MTEIEDFEDDLSLFEQSVGGARAVLAEFSGEMRSMQSTVSDTKQEVEGLEKGLSRGFKSGVEGLVFGGKDLSQSLRSVMQSTVGSVYKASMSPLLSQASGALANGFSGAMRGLVPFAKGGVVERPTAFPMRGGAGLMGEAGPEAIMPLTRGADGRLGVRSAGAEQRPIQVVMNISTPDVGGFQRSQSQIAAQMGRALARGSRNR